MWVELPGVGLDWRFSLKGPLYIRPGVGIVVHDGPSYRVDYTRHEETDLGSRVLFEPELGVGYQLDPKLSLEASWTHISQGRLFNWNQNPGIDMWGDVTVAYTINFGSQRVVEVQRMDS